MTGSRSYRVGALAFAILRLVFVLSLLPLALAWREPFLADYRPYLFVGLLALPTAFAAAEFIVFPRLAFPRARSLSNMVLAVALVDLLSVITIEARFQWIRWQVVHAEPEQLTMVGRHIVVGFRSLPELQDLVDRRAIAGVFLTTRNVQAIGSAALAADVRAMQDMRTRQGLPKLWIATDQEGGRISRLSPPLTQLPALSDIVARHPDPADRAAAITEFANTQGRELADIGVNLNFAPVVDLNYHLINPKDRYTRIYERAIAADPEIVRDVAGEYCAALLEAGVHCTLKHFPGLGRVSQDTHAGSADLAATVGELSAADWVPFRALMNENAFTMLSHVRLTNIDPDRPASISRTVVADLLRRDWNYNGVLITDDFGMAAIYGGRDGIEGGAVEALTAGVDLILVSFDPDQYYPIMHALLDAYRDHRLSRDLLLESDRRLATTATHGH